MEQLWRYLKLFKAKILAEPPTQVIVREGPRRSIRISSRPDGGSGPALRKRSRIRKVSSDRINRVEKLLRVLDWIRTEYSSVTGTTYLSFEPFLQALAHTYITRGPQSAISYIKRVRVLYLQYLSGAECAGGVRWRRRTLGLLGVSVEKASSPKSPEPEMVRWTLMVLTLLRSEVLPVSIDTEPIEAGFKGNSLELDSVGSEVGEFWELLKRRVGAVTVRRVQWRKFHHSTKRGPSGGNALFGALWDAMSLPESLVESLRVVGGANLGAILDFVRWNGQMFKEIQSKIEILDPNPSKRVWSDWGYTTIRRLTGIQDKEGKTRVVAILDYWSQTVLAPVHTFLFEVLRVIPQDVTFDQGSFRKKVESWGPTTYYSVDLSKATDRFPIRVIKSVLSSAFGPVWANHWENILIGYPFKLKDREVFYSVGNPMGAYSSWASFALAHHYVMYVCCKKAGVEWEDARYVILGDDVAIGDERLGPVYRREMELLGVDVAVEKTLISKEILEFAKRYIYRGEEVSPFPASSVMEADHRFVSLMVASLQQEEKKGLRPLSGVKGAIQSFFREVHHNPKKVIDRLGERVDRCIAASLFLRGQASAVETVLELSKTSLLGGVYSSEHWAEDRCRSFLFKCLAQLFVEQVGREKKDKRKHFLFPVVFWIQTHDRFAEAWPQIFRSIPLLQVVQLAEVRLLEVEETAVGILEGREDDILVRTLCDPMADVSIGLSYSERVAVVSERFASVVNRAFVKGEGLSEMKPNPIRSSVLWCFADQKDLRSGIFIPNHIRVRMGKRGVTPPKPVMDQAVFRIGDRIVSKRQYDWWLARLTADSDDDEEILSLLALQCGGAKATKSGP